MNIREIVETQVTQSSKAGKPVSGNAQFALLMSLFNQPGPPLINTPDTLSFHQPHAITRPMHFSHSIEENPIANIALLKALSFEPLAEGPAYQYDAVESLEQQINIRI
ncbi:hypothetical protein A8139_07180 [Marinomonas primoryensis]|jgi:hypothetical protein|uniref:Uncharacterized protein n=1 Tax=Marinomonas primoryensis TaxID=178399 RepID=A0A2Z4PQC2_9GAMM|nr:hypothetical protein [Marinomonas primoryensis]AWX99797.1 hypothetical protein A8139_07180 [Marinomonas primoryensis]|tara:strand:+ start:9504 stop:9827 length:324 start_codon:yes stop_codon:yes gene_type:complete